MKNKEQNKEGIILVVNVKSSGVSYTSENLKEVVSDIFGDYILKQ